MRKSDRAVAVDKFFRDLTMGTIEIEESDDERPYNSDELTYEEPEYERN